MRRLVAIAKQFLARIDAFRRLVHLQTGDNESTVARLTTLRIPLLAGSRLLALGVSGERWHDRHGKLGRTSCERHPKETDCYSTFHNRASSSSVAV